MSTARRRSAEWEAELARRSNVSHDRTKAEADAKAAAEAEERGRIGKWADELRDPDRRSDRRDALASRLFPTPDEPEPSNRPQGSADGGVGEVEEYEIERIATDAGFEELRVFPVDNDSNTDTKETTP